MRQTIQMYWSTNHPRQDAPQDSQPTRRDLSLTTLTEAHENLFYRTTPAWSIGQYTNAALP